MIMAMKGPAGGRSEKDGFAEQQMESFSQPLK